ncbi:hypothetical protein HZH68_000658 [Vespula germanica]|uniref:Uncharacterized protein n=1 Tax=Vespula germanica TaxID=30212 RepID=A0A834U685_VESGE|nr:hypothetical protein HZH68_000658 [Vespula germanica]
MMEMVKEKPRRRSVSELLDWRSITGLKGGAANFENNDTDGIFFEDYDKSPETRRRKRSGTWPEETVSSTSPVWSSG